MGCRARIALTLTGWLTLSDNIDPNQASVSLAKLQNPIKSSFDSINDNLKETHSGLNKYSKALDKVEHEECPRCNVDYADYISYTPDLTR